PAAVRPPGAICLGLLVLVAAIGLSSTEGGDAQTIEGTPASGDFAGLIKIADGRRLYLECHGTGSPTVILEAALRGPGANLGYSLAGGDGPGVLPRVASFTHVCRYDRPGTLAGLDALSRSDPVRMPRTTGAVASDLHQLLTTAGVPGP